MTWFLSSALLIHDSTAASLGGTAALRGPSWNMFALGGSPSASAPGSTAMAGASGPELELPGASALPLGPAGTSGTISGAAGAGGEYEEETLCFGKFAGAPLGLGSGENK